MQPTVTPELSALDLERALDPHEVAEILGVARVTLQQWRAQGKGPRYFKLGRRAVRYRLADVLVYRAALTVGRQP
jgi:predicted DNA-binding transcriptional regulator AlpA